MPAGTLRTVSYLGALEARMARGRQGARVKLDDRTVRELKALVGTGLRGLGAIANA